MRSIIRNGTIVLGLVLAAAMVKAEEPAQTQESSQAEAQKQTQARESVYGWELMTDEEFAQHRTKMRSLRTREERQRYRAEHHAQMMERAQERGVDLIGPAPGRGRGAGQPPGVGKGQEKGQGGGGRGSGSQR